MEVRFESMVFLWDDKIPTMFLEFMNRGCVKMHTLFFYDKAPTFPSRGFVIT